LKTLNAFNAIFLNLHICAVNSLFHGSLELSSVIDEQDICLVITAEYRSNYETQQIICNNYVFVLFKNCPSLMPAHCV